MRAARQTGQEAEEATHARESTGIRDAAGCRLRH